MSLPVTRVDWAGLAVGHGTPWHLRPGNGLLGWLDTPDVDRGLVGAPATAGDFDTPVLPRGRTVVVSGSARSAERDSMIANLRAATTLVGLHDLTVTVAGQTLRSPARLTRRTVTPEQWGLGRFDWSLTFRCPDPYLLGPEVIYPLSFPTPVSGSGLQYPLVYPLSYGAAGADTSQVFVPNPGTVPMFLRARVDGPSLNPRIFTDTGSQVRVGVTVPAGQWLDVLTAERRVLANGQVSRRYATSFVGDWLAIPPGGAVVGWSDDSLSPAARLWLFAPEGAWI